MSTLGDSDVVLASGDVFVNDTDTRTRLAVDHHLSANDWPTLVDHSARESAARLRENV